MDVRGRIELALSDGTTRTLRPERIVVPRPTPRPGKGAIVARLEARLGMGDLALAVGQVQPDGRADVVVLGEQRSLRRALVVAWIALAWLVVLAAGVVPLIGLVTR